MAEVVALFATRVDAARAIDSLGRMGYDASSLGYMKSVRDDVANAEHDVPTGGAKTAVGGIFGDATEHFTHARKGVEGAGALVTINVLVGDTPSVATMLRDLGAKKVDVLDAHRVDA